MTDKSSDAKKASSSSPFTAEERAAMKEHAAEVKAQAKQAKGAAQAEADLQAQLAKIAELADGDRALAEQVHSIVMAAAPHLSPKLWYGMPGYAKDGAIVCFFQPAAKFKTRYSTFGFNEAANLDDGDMWPVAFALTKIGAKQEAAITRLVTQASG